MIKSVLSKIRSNIWMFICLIVGSLLITGVLASIPMYSAGTLRQMLASDMAANERKTGKPAGQLYFSVKLKSADHYAGRIKSIESIQDTVIGGISGDAVKIKNKYVYVFSSGLLSQTKLLDRSGGWSLGMLTDFEKNIEITEGRLYGESAEDGVIEVIVSEKEWAENKNAVLGEVCEFEFEDSAKKERTVKVKPVGIFKEKDPDSAFWYDNSKLFSNAFFCSKAAYEKYFYNESDADSVSQIGIYMNLDFSNAGIDNLGGFISYYNKIYNYAKDFGIGRNEVNFPSVFLINSYIRKTAAMEMSLWVLNVPVIAMLAFYMIMVTTMIIEEDKNEISTFKSRGAKTSQIFLRYVIESAFVSVFALIIGPPIGFLLAKTVGNASGFMEFESAVKMPIKLSVWAYVYAIVACVFFSALILIPALLSTKKTIVNLKQRKARKSRLAWWEKWCVDIVCLVVAIGLLIIYKRTSGFNVDGTVDPVVYIISTLFILGSSLLFLRIYPYIVALFFALFKRTLRPAPYSAFVQVSRGGGDYRFLMLFLMMTISIGIYSSASARIINNNVENTVNYENGADVVIKPDFSGDLAPYEYNEETGETEYVPDFFRHFNIQKYTDNDFVTAASRVAHYEGNSIIDEERGYSLDYPVEIMAIDPYEFGQISWCATSLNGVNWHEYINMLELSPTSVLISRDLAEASHSDVGDVIELNINGSNQYDEKSHETMKCYVAAIIDYWPTIEKKEPLVMKGWNGNSVSISQNCFVIMNFEYIWSIRDTTDFDIYLAITDKAKTSREVFTEMALKSGIIDNKEQISVYRPEIMFTEKSDSMLKGLNGSYSIGFVSTLTVAFVGFVIYWIMNVRKRKLQFGILRAMGMTKGNLTAMLICEHLLTTGVSVVMGLLVGALTVKVYTPLLKVAYANQTLPLVIIYNRTDITKILAVVAAMLITGIIVLAAFINKLKINEAVKIGEE